MIKEVEKKKAWEISHYDDHNPTIRILINDYNYSFSVEPVRTEMREWLGEVVARQMQEIHDRAVAKTKKEMQAEFRKLIGIDK